MLSAKRTSNGVFSTQDEGSKDIIFIDRQRRTLPAVAPPLACAAGVGDQAKAAEASGTAHRRSRRLISGVRCSCTADVAEGGSRKLAAGTDCSAKMAVARSIIADNLSHPDRTWYHRRRRSGMKAFCELTTPSIKQEKRPPPNTKSTALYTPTGTRNRVCHARPQPLTRLQSTNSSEAHSLSARIACHATSTCTTL